jgi:hypothetical protein
MPKRIHRTIERIIIAAMLLGIVGMFQPFAIELYTWGFHLVVFGTLAFIIITHIPAREEATEG